MDRCDTIRVKPWGEGQGEFVEINADDFDPKVHRPFNAEEAAKAISDAAHVDLSKEPSASDPLPANPDDLVSPPVEQVANEEVAAPTPKPTAKRRRKRGK